MSVVIDVVCETMLISHRFMQSTDGCAQHGGGMLKEHRFQASPTIPSARHRIST